MKLFEYTTGDATSLEASLKTSLKQGLSEQQVEAYRKLYGYNEIPENNHHWWYFLFAQLKSPFLIVLMGAALLSFFLEGHATSIMIVLIIMLNTVVGFYQEYRADCSVRLLKNMIPQLVIVCRDGKDQQIPARDLVPGDIVIVETGSIMAADMRFIEADNLMIDESMLTGESVAVTKQWEPLAVPVDEITKAVNIGYAGTLVVGGRGRAVVLATGTKTMQGSLGALAEKIAPESVFFDDISRFTKVLLKGIALIFILFIVIHLVWGKADVDFFQVILFILALAVSLTPEALPIVIMFTLSRSARKLAQEKVIVKRLSAVNDLGSIQILCVDKTGTLTQNSMAVAAWQAADEQTLWAYAALSCERPHVEHRGSHSLDDALWDIISDDTRQQVKRYSLVKVIPFDPAQRSNEVIVSYNEQAIHIMRGACESILERCGLDYGTNECEWAIEQGTLGRRVIGVASNEGDGWHLIGFVSFTDPLKPTVQAALKNAADLRVQVKLITGDAPEVAGVIAQEAGIIPCKKEVVLGRDLIEMSPEELETVVERCHVFARVAPEQKYLIVHALQQKYAVGFLGDGINDVLALKAAHVGIVVQGCTDVAREAADIVLLKKSLSSIVHGIRAGRESVMNTKKYVTATLASNVGNFCAISLSSLFVNFLPLEPVQILLLNFLSDFPMLAISGDTVDPEELHKPAYFDIPWLLIVVIVLGITSSSFDFLMFYLFSQEPQVYLQTYWFIGCICTELVFIFSIRTKRPIWKATAPGRMLVLLSGMGALAACSIPFTGWGQEYFQFISPRWYGIKIIMMVSVLFLCVMEGVKLILYRCKDAKKNKYNCL